MPYPNSSQWGAGWGALSPFLRAWQSGRPYYKDDKQAPWYQSPYATDASSSSARAAAGLNPTIDRSSIDYTELAKKQMQEMLGGILPGYFNAAGGSGGTAQGGTTNTNGIDLSKYYQLFRDDQGMIHDFGDNPISSQLQGLGNTGNANDLLQNGMNYLNNQYKPWQSRHHGGNGYKPVQTTPIQQQYMPMSTGEYSTTGRGSGGRAPYAPPSTTTTPPPITTTTPPPLQPPGVTQTPYTQQSLTKSRWSVF